MVNKILIDREPRWILASVIPCRSPRSVGPGENPTRHPHTVDLVFTIHSPPITDLPKMTIRRVRACLFPVESVHETHFFPLVTKLLTAV